VPLSDRLSVGWLVLPRLAAGALLLSAGVQKLRAAFDGAALADALRGWQAAGATLSFYDQNIAPWVLAHAGLVAALVTWGELLAGASLVLGLATRLGALVGFALAANYLCASGEAVNALLLATHVALLGGAGRAFGLDATIRSRVSAWFVG
jgi:uncharacterized membrane protein YphA (DoxX/SURF4 family)